MAEEISFTQEQLDEAIQNAKNEWIEKEFNPIKTELEEVKAKLPKELSDEEKALQKKQKELFDKEIQLTLKENGLEQFKDIIKVENEKELKETIKKLNKIINNIKIEVGYVPEDHKQVTAYEQAKQKGDTKGMIATKLSKLFG